MSARSHIKQQKERILARIGELQQELSFWDELERIDQEGLIERFDEKKKSPKSLGQLVTYFRTIELIHECTGPVSTALILKYLQDGCRDNRNTVTLRSHLRRLREGGLLVQNASTKTWSVP